jgi:NADH-quinone oxidoreductase subunit M
VLLTATIFTPLAGALLCLAVPRPASAATGDPVRQARARRAANLARVVALAASLVALGLAVALAARFRTGEPGFQLGQSAGWVGSLGIRYRVGLDGISLPLVLLTVLLTPLALLGAWRIPQRPRGYAALVLTLESALLGVFSALDLFLFYILWEAVLIPSYFLIGLWGGERRVYAAVKFFLYTLLGGLLMLVSIIGLHYLQRRAGDPSFDFEVLRDLAKSDSAQRWLLVGFFAAFAIKTPLFPFHTWLPDAYTEAHPTTTVLLAGVMSKMGVYGFIRYVVQLLPEGARAAEPVVLTLAVVGILYAALVAVAQRDLDRLIAYSSVSHMGFMVLGAFALTVQGIQGAVFYMVAHGLIIGGLFFLVGMLAERTASSRIADHGGLQRVVPRLAGVLLVLALASAALPGLAGFVGEFLVLFGAFLNNRLTAVLGVGGVILAAVYLLWAYQRMFHGEVTSERDRALPDLSPREWLVLMPILAAVIGLGLFPRPLLDRVEPAARQVAEQAGAAAAQAPAP